MRDIDVLELLRLLDERAIFAWVDGGWGVDALVGQQTRAHADVDLVVGFDDLPSLHALLLERGFVVARDWLPNAVAYRDADGRHVDVHPVERTADGGGDQILMDGRNRFHYSPPTSGTIAGKPVRCCPAQDQVRCHQGYEPDAHDRADMAILAERFRLRLPPPYAASG